MAQAAREATEPALVPVPAPVPTEVPPPAPKPTTTAGTSTFVPTAPTTLETIAPTLSMILPPALLALIWDIHGDFGCILRCFDRLGKKVESMDQRLIHIEGIVDPSWAPAPSHILDNLASDEEDKDDNKESNEDT